MTGRVGEVYTLHTKKKEFDVKNLGKIDVFLSKLLTEMDNKSMMGASIAKNKKGRGEAFVVVDGERVGLISGHAYGLMDILDIEVEKLVRLRNPWGSTNPIEWNGPWSDNSPELIKNIEILNKKNLEKWGKEAEKYEIESKDGAFLMSFK